MSFGNLKIVLFAILMTCISATQAKSQQIDVISLDLSNNLPPQLVTALLDAEAIWEERLIGFSTELPRAILLQLTTVRINAVVEMLDGPCGLLGFAGPDTVLSLTPPLSPLSFNVANPVFFPVTGEMTFDIFDSLPTTQEGQDLLTAVAIHEMGHALGFGTLWQQNGIIGNENILSNGLSQYTGGTYALPEYRRAINEPFAPFVPISQPDLGHWAEAPGFVFPEENIQDIMLATAGTIANPDPEFILTDTTFAAMADLGYAVSGVNEQFLAPRGNGTGRWPKVNGVLVNNPFAANGVAAANGLNVQSFTGRASISLPAEETDRLEIEITNTNRIDPYNLRNLRWSNSLGN